MVGSGDLVADRSCQISIRRTGRAHGRPVPVCRSGVTRVATAEGLRVAVIIPAYHARDTIKKVLDGIPAWVDAVYVVDDGSNDGTSALVQAHRDPRVALLSHPVNRGVGAAMVTGYSEALRHGIDICVKMDADDQMDPAYLTDLIRPLLERRADYVKGNRFHDATALRRMPFLRKVGNAGLSFLIKAASGTSSIPPTATPRSTAPSWRCSI